MEVQETIPKSPEVSMNLAEHSFKLKLKDCVNLLELNRANFKPIEQ
jgi:hypothetical protein